MFHIEEDFSISFHHIEMHVEKFLDNAYASKKLSNILGLNIYNLIIRKECSPPPPYKNCVFLLNDNWNQYILLMELHPFQSIVYDDLVFHIREGANSFLYLNERIPVAGVIFHGISAVLIGVELCWT